MFKFGRVSICTISGHLGYPSLAGFSTKIGMIPIEVIGDNSPILIIIPDLGGNYNVPRSRVPCFTTETEKFARNEGGQPLDGPAIGPPYYPGQFQPRNPSLYTFENTSTKCKNNTEHDWKTNTCFSKNTSPLQNINHFVGVRQDCMATNDMHLISGTPVREPWWESRLHVPTSKKTLCWLINGLPEQNDESLLKFWCPPNVSKSHCSGLILGWH